VAQQSNSGLGRLIVEVSRLHAIRHTHTFPVVLFWTSDQLVAEALTYTRKKQNKKETEERTYVFCPGFETGNPTRPTDRASIYALDRMANCTIGNSCLGRQALSSLHSTTRIKVEEIW